MVNGTAIIVAYEHDNPDWPMPPTADEREACITAVKLKFPDIRVACDYGAPNELAWHDPYRKTPDDAGAEETEAPNSSDFDSDLTNIDGDAAAGAVMKALSGGAFEITHDPEYDYIDDNGQVHRRLLFRRNT
jgi:hypothetical protein